MSFFAIFIVAVLFVKFVTGSQTKFKNFQVFLLIILSSYFVYFLVAQINRTQIYASVVPTYNGEKFKFVEQGSLITRFNVMVRNRLIGFEHLVRPIFGKGSGIYKNINENRFLLPAIEAINYQTFMLDRLGLFTGWHLHDIRYFSLIDENGDLIYGLVDREGNSTPITAGPFSSRWDQILIYDFIEICNAPNTDSKIIELQSFMKFVLNRAEDLTHQKHSFVQILAHEIVYDYQRHEKFTIEKRIGFISEGEVTITDPNCSFPTFGIFVNWDA